MGLRGRKQLLNYNCFFLTTTCRDFSKFLSQGRNFDVVSENIIYYNEKYEVETLGYVLMPNHIHFIQIFIKENRLSDYMRDFKKYSSKEIRDELLFLNPDQIESIRFVKKTQRFKIWNDRFDDQAIFTIEFLHQKLNYIHNNPLQERWKLAQTPEDYKYSSANFYMTGVQGIIPVTHYLKYFSPSPAK